MATSQCPLSLWHLLQSNTVPSAIEEISVRHALIRIDSNIAALDDEIMKTRLILLELEKKRKLAAEEQATHLGVLSAIRRFPLEIIGEILWFARPKSGQFELLQLSTVSRSWRNAAFSTHKLWAVLDINISEYVQYVENIGTEEILMDGLCRWIERSGSLPLELFMGLEHIDTKRAGRLFLRVIKRLPAKNRWKQVEISLYGDNSSMFAFLFDNDHQIPWDSLELLDVRRWSNGDSSPRRPPKTISLQTVTNLKRLKLQLFDEPLSAKYLHAPWAQLTELELLAYIPLADYFAILKKCPNLEVFEVSFMNNDHGPTTTTPPAPLPSRLVLPKIRRLGIWRCFDNSQIDPFLQSLELPNISDLSIQGDEESEEPLPSVTDTILSFIECSNCEILKLELHYTRDSDADLSRLLSHMCSLAKLHITSCKINGSLFDSPRRMAYGLKNLKVLKIYAEAGKFYPLRLAKFVDHCHSSPGSKGKLKYVSLNYEGGEFPENICRALKKKGVTFDIRTRFKS